MKKTLSLLAVICLFGHNTLHAKLYSVGLDKSQYTSDFLMGKVVVSVIFPESDGTLDANTETWSDDRKTQVLSKIMAGLDWWTKQNPRSPLSFTVVSQTIATKYEPITRPYYDESLWIPNVMSKLGYTGNQFTSVRKYVNDLRTQYNADWGFVAFVVDSQKDTDGKFADGLFGYAYLGGPFLMLTYDNDGYGIANMDVVLAHEVGHIFNALDEYAGASSPNDYSSGYYSTINGNHAFSATADDPTSIMRGGIRWGLDKWAKLMVGWRDNDKNGLDDILNGRGATSLSSTVQSIAGTNIFSGDANVSVLARQSNASGNGFTLDTIARVEYRLKNGDWAQAIPVDGAFDSAHELFRIAVPQTTGAQAIGASDLDVRSITAYSLISASGGGGSGGAGPTPTSLDDAHVYPNPFKPNSSLGHAQITFTQLTPAAKVQIFTPVGEPVFEKKLDASSTSYNWDAVNDSGEKVSSGVYYYLITDDSGHKKKGKLAIIR